MSLLQILVPFTGLDVKHDHSTRGDAFMCCCWADRPVDQCLPNEAVSGGRFGVFSVGVVVACTVEFRVLGLIDSAPHLLGQFVPGADSRVLDADQSKADILLPDRKVNEHKDAYADAP